MIESHVAVRTADGDMDTFIVHPDGAGPYPGVIMYQYVGGLTEDLLDLARRIATEGYYCAVPSLYWRVGTIITDPDNLSEETENVRKAAVPTVWVPFRVMEDTRSLLSYMDNDPVVKDGPKGAIGYCMGGYFAPLAAGLYPDQIRASISCFGVRMLDDRPDSPVRYLDKIEGETYIAFGELDYRTPPELVSEYERLLAEKCTAEWKVEVHKGADHGYAFAARSVFNKAASDLTWERTFAMFDRQLR